MRTATGEHQESIPKSCSHGRRILSSGGGVADLHRRGFGAGGSETEDIHRTDGNADAAADAGGVVVGHVLTWVGVRPGKWSKPPSTKRLEHIV